MHVVILNIIPRDISSSAVVVTVGAGYGTVSQPHYYDLTDCIRLVLFWDYHRRRFKCRCFFRIFAVEAILYKYNKDRDIYGLTKLKDLFWVRFRYEQQILKLGIRGHDRKGKSNHKIKLIAPNKTIPDRDQLLALLLRRIFTYVD